MHSNLQLLLNRLLLYINRIVISVFNLRDQVWKLVNQFLLHAFLVCSRCRHTHINSNTVYVKQAYITE